MRNNLIYFACFASFSSGCDVIHATVRTMVTEPLQFNPEKEVHAIDRRQRSWANAVWDDVVARSGSVDYSDDFARGFKSGYVEQVKSGMNAAPPPIPPRKYWKDRYRSERGRQAVNDWYMGFRLGIELAQQVEVHGDEKVPTSQQLQFQHNLPTSSEPPPAPGIQDESQLGTH